ncbi:MAG TPA: hypothetical protein DSN98_03310 [Thermoplasmata archaeon]|nr:MAG TPA: hypothetical protein DSN98_03310 [Thermoplasmata archaeon]
MTTSPIKKSLHERIIEITLLQIIGIIIIGISDLVFNWVAFWLTWTSTTILTLIIWQLLAKSILKNREKVPGRAFEFLFFLFLFLSSYAITFIASFVNEPSKIIDSVFMYILFIPSFVSSVYCGWLYYIKGVYN